MEQREDNVITFSLVWGVIKKSFVRAVIYVLVSVILAAALLFVCKKFTASNNYGATITLKREDKNAKTTLENRKATAISNAVRDNCPNIDAEDFNEIYNDLYETVVIVPVIPEEKTENNKEEEFIPVTYQIVQEKEVEGLSAEKQIAILQDIATELVKEYSKIYSANPINPASFGFTVAEQGKYKEEYLEVIDSLQSGIQVFSQIISAGASTDGNFYNFRGTSADTLGLTVNEITARLNNITSRAAKIENSIKVLGITNSNAKVNGAAYVAQRLELLTMDLDRLTASIANYKDDISVMQEIIKNFDTSGGGVSGSGVIINVSMQPLVDLIEKREQAMVEKVAVESDIKKLEDYVAAINVNATDNAENSMEIEQDIIEIVEEVEEMRVAYNALAEDFNKTYVPSGYASVSQAAHKTDASFISWMLLIVAVVAVGVVAYVVAFGQTWSSLKKAGNLNEKYLHTPQKKQPKEKAE